MSEKEEETAAVYIKTRPDWGYRVENWMGRELGLRGGERDVYAIVYAFTFDQGWKQFELEWLAEFSNTSKATCQRAIKNLTERGLFKKMNASTPYGPRINLVAMKPANIGVSAGKEGVLKMTTPPSQNDQAPLVKMTTPPSQNDHHKLDNNLIGKHDNNNKEHKNIQESLIEDNKTAKSKQKNKFVPPTLDAVVAYVKERNSDVDPQQFFDYYDVADWKDSQGKQVKNWKQRMCSWERRGNGGDSRGPGQKRVPVYEVDQNKQWAKGF